MDKIFLLSYAEANQYLGVTYGANNNTASRAAATAYALERGAFQSNSNKTADGDPAGWWWLRSPGLDRSFAAYVFHGGSLIYGDVDIASGCVRPALWINLESDIF